MNHEAACKLVKSWSGVRTLRGKVHVCVDGDRLVFATDGTSHSLDLASTDIKRARAHFVGFVQNTLGVDLNRPVEALLVRVNGGGRADTHYRGTVFLKNFRARFEGTYKHGGPMQLRIGLDEVFLHAPA